MMRQEPDHSKNDGAHSNLKAAGLGFALRLVLTHKLHMPLTNGNRNG